MSQLSYFGLTIPLAQSSEYYSVLYSFAPESVSVYLCALYNTEVILT